MIKQVVWRSCVAALAIMALPIAVVPAQATMSDLGALPTGTPVVHSGVLSASNPSDILTFSVPSAKDVGAALQSFRLGVFGMTLYDFSSLNASIFSGMPGSGAFVGTITSGTDGSFLLPMGAYYTEITGTPTGTNGGLYTLALLASNAAAPVPGPAGFLVGGAGLVVIALRRRRQQAAERQLANA